MESALREVASAVNTVPTSLDTLHPQLQAFCRDTRRILEQGSERERLEQVRDRLKLLLKDDDFLAAHCGPDADPGLHVLYEDPDLKFQVIAHVNDKPRTSPPHNHGESWAIYGQAVGHTDMTEWCLVEETLQNDCVVLPRMSTSIKYRLTRGHAGLFSHGAIHSIDYPAASRFVRVTGVNLDLIERQVFDPLTGASRTVGKPR